MTEKIEFGPPPEWSDDEVMAVLFSPFRESRDLNPSSWDRKLRFWNQAITKKCQFEGTAVFDAKQLPKKFERKGHVPCCLGIVVQDMIKKGHLQSLNDVMSDSSQSWASWSFGLLIKRPITAGVNIFVKKPLMWTYNKVFSSSTTTSAFHTGGDWDSTKDLEGKKFVLVELVKCLADQIQKAHFANQDPVFQRIISMTRLRRFCEGICKDDISFQLALQLLIKQKKCMITELDGQQMVLFAESENEICKPLSSTEITVFKLNKSQSELYDQIDSIRNEMEKLRIEAKNYLQRGMKMSAKNCLRRKKRLEALQDKKEAAIENIHQLMSTIEQTHSDKKVLDAYSTGISTYKDLTKKYGLTPEAVDDIMVNIQEVLENQEELSRSIAMPLSPDDMTSDDLERELEGIMDENNILANIPLKDPHQAMIDAMCKMKVCNDVLPDVTSNVPGHPISTSSPAKPSRTSSRKFYLPASPVGFSLNDELEPDIDLELELAGISPPGEDDVRTIQSAQHEAIAS